MIYISIRNCHLFLSFTKMKLLMEQMDQTVTEYDFIEVHIGVYMNKDVSVIIVIKMLALTTADVSTDYRRG